MKKTIKRKFDQDGEKEVTTYTNGVKVTALIQPSAEYQARDRPKAVQEEDPQEQYNLEILIRNKLREIAIKELLEEGKIPAAKP